MDGGQTGVQDSWVMAARSQRPPLQGSRGRFGAYHMVGGQRTGQERTLGEEQFPRCPRGPRRKWDSPQVFPLKRYSGGAVDKGGQS